MSKPNSYLFKGTKGELVATIASLPPKPNKKFYENWTDITDSRAKEHSTSVTFKNNDNGLKIRFDPAEKGAPGFKGKNHYHVFNPDATGVKDRYLDKDGNPVSRNSKASHIIPES